MSAQTHYRHQKQDRNGRNSSRAIRWRARRDAHMATRWFLWFWVRACLEFRQQVQDAWDNIAGWHSALWGFSCENTRLHCFQKRYTLYWCDILGSPYCDICFIWFEFIIYSYNDKLHVTSIFNTVNLSLRALNFFSAVYYLDAYKVTESTPVVQWLSYSLLDPRFADSIPAGYDFLRKGSKAVGPVL